MILGLAFVLGAVSAIRLRAHDRWWREMRKGDGVEPQFFKQQRIDHENPTSGTWAQRYWVNDSVYDHKNGPLFVYISGEGTGSGGATISSEMATFGAEHGALLVALEHRFYGASYPVPSLDLEALKLLRSDQALADLAVFIDFVKKAYNMTPEAKVVTWGGSYAGALSSWARLKHGDTVYAALASSGPVEAQLNFVGYMDVVGASLGDPAGGGNAECPVLFKAAFQAAQAALAKDEAGTLSILQSCQTSLNGSSSNLWTLWENLGDDIAGAVQYNREIEGAMNISDVCGYFAGVSKTDPQALLQALGALSKATLKEYGMTCYDNNFVSSQITPLSNTSWQPQQEGVGIRQWTFQTCNEFGYYQTCSTTSNCPMGVDMGLEPFLDICQQVFSISPTQVAANVNASLQDHGGNSTAPDRVFYMDGTIDPWHWLAITHQINPTSPSVLMNGTAHCRDLHAPRSDDPQSLKSARIELGKFLNNWL